MRIADMLRSLTRAVPQRETEPRSSGSGASPLSHGLASSRFFGTLATILLLPICSAAEKPFAPLEEWKSAVMSGDQASIEKFYSPEAVTQVGKDRIALKDEWAFWAGLKKTGMTTFNPRLLEVIKVKGNTELLLRISVTSSGNSHLYGSVRQDWAHQADGWKIVASRREAHR